MKSWSLVFVATSLISAMAVAEEIPMKRPLHPVLVVADEPDEWSSKYVQLALDIPGTEGKTDSGIDVTVAKSSELAGFRLTKFRCIYLVDVKSLKADTLAAIKQHVKSGAVLCLFLGKSADAKFYRTLFDKRGKGLLPVAIGEVARIERGKPKAGIELVAKDHRALRRLDEPILLQPVEVNCYRTIDQSAKPKSTQVIFKLRNGDPLMLAHQFGKGRVITLLTSPDRESTNWMIQPSWVVTLLLIHEHVVGDEARTGQELNKTE